MHRSLRILIILFLLAGSIFVNPVTPAYAQEISIPAQINKQFDPIAITAGDISKLSVTIYNPNTYELTDAAWTDNLVGIQPGLRIADDVNLVNTCDGVTPSTVIADPGGATLSLSGATVPPQTGATPGECTVTVDVTSTTAGNLLNKIPENT